MVWAVLDKIVRYSAKISGQILNQQKAPHAKGALGLGQNAHRAPFAWALPWIWVFDREWTPFFSQFFRGLS